MIVHPYRIASAPRPPRSAPEDRGALAFGVLGVTGAVQVAVSIIAAGQPVMATLTGAAAFVAALCSFTGVQLTGGVPSGGGSRSR